MESEKGGQQENELPTVPVEDVQDGKNLQMNARKRTFDGDGKNFFSRLRFKCQLFFLILILPISIISDKFSKYFLQISSILQYQSIVQSLEMDHHGSSDYIIGGNQLFI